MSLGRLLRGAGLYAIGSALPRGVAFLLLPVYAAAMLPESFGVFSLALTLIGLLVVLYRLGLDGAMVRLHFDMLDRRRPALYRSLAAVTGVAVIGGSIVVGAALAAGFEALLPGVPFAPVGLLILAVAALSAFGYIPTSLFRAAEQPVRFVAFSVGAAATGIGATAYFLLVARMDVTGALLGQLASAVFVAGFSAVALLRLRGGGPEWRLARAGLAFGVPLVPHGLAGWAMNLSDRWLIGLLIGLPALAAQAAVGVYSFGYLVGQVAGIAAISFNAAWTPTFFQRGEGPAGPRLLREMTTLSLGGLSLIVAGIALLGPVAAGQLARGVWGAQALAMADVSAIVAFSALPYGLYFMLVGTLFLRKQTRGLPLLTMAAAATGIGANLVLIPTYGIVGAAWATLGSYAVLAGLTWWLAARGYRIHLDLRRLGLILLATVAALVAARVLATPSLTVQLVRGMALLAALAGVNALLLRGPVGSLRGLLAAGSDAPAPGSRQPPDTIGAPKEDA
ncbi:MAG TPA: polysaccharide biosynthesis C-terminal domain-containing protein [Candidatus Limnocylindria bacterium]|nr:polysaccharide biosynthesis C-terminal domain-containing protein [Candidatus Limnocylindria bacterium]